jgi:hypothetical protein
MTIIGDYVDPEAEQHRQAVASRIWDMIIETYGDNLCERKDGTIVYQSQWHEKLMYGIQGILREEYPNG